MTTPWTEVLQAVPTLNDERAPFSYSVDGETIVGFWDVAKIQMLGIAGASSFDKEYRITVTPAGDDSFATNEVQTESSGSVSPGGLSFGKSTFSGTKSEKSFGITLGAGGTSHDEPTSVAGWSFDTEEIKRPLYGLLEQHGWKKQGLLGKLFG